MQKQAERSRDQKGKRKRKKKTGTKRRTREGKQLNLLKKWVRIHKEV